MERGTGGKRERQGSEGEHIGSACALTGVLGGLLWASLRMAPPHTHTPLCLSRCVRLRFFSLCPSFPLRASVSQSPCRRRRRTHQLSNGVGPAADAVAGCGAGGGGPTAAYVSLHAGVAVRADKQKAFFFHARGCPPSLSLLSPPRLRVVVHVTHSLSLRVCVCSRPFSRRGVGRLMMDDACGCTVMRFWHTRRVQADVR